MSTTTGFFIPHVYLTIPEDKIREVFGIYGRIKNIHFSPKVGADGRKYNAVFINFEELNETSETQNLIEELGEKGKAHVYYDEKWYWIVLFNTSKKTKDDDANKENRAPGPVSNKVLTKPKPTTPSIPLQTLSVNDNNNSSSSSSSSRHIPTSAAWALVAAPKKKSKKSDDITAAVAELSLGGAAAAAAMEAEAEALIPEEDFNLVDADYVYKLEEDNNRLRMEINRLIAQQETYMNLFRHQAVVIASFCTPGAAAAAAGLNPNQNTV
jgi:hypothetical protein